MSALDPRQAMAELESLQQRLQAGERRLGALEQAMMELQQAIVTLEAIGSGETEGPVLVPIGAGVHVQARFDTQAPVVRPIGADTSVGGTPEDAVEALKKRRGELQAAFQETQQELQQAAARGRQLQQALPQAEADQAAS